MTLLQSPGKKSETQTITALSNPEFVNSLSGNRTRNYAASIGEPNSS